MKQRTGDADYMRQCIEIAAEGAQSRDFPFGALVVLDGKLISKRHNESLDKNQVYRHAEMLALLDAQEILSPEELTKATLYSTVEPCGMCSFAIQELNIERVVFGLRSPVMGGYTKWPILQDQHINDMFPNTFGRVPEIVPDVLRDEVIEGWQEWNKEQWRRFIQKNVF